MKELLLSIIVPAYNAEKYIKPCIESLYKQNLQEDEFEIILINDGSTDNTLSIVKTFSKLHSNINIISQVNQGLSITRNNGITNAKGKYILFVDSDDVLVNNSIKMMLNIAIDNSSIKITFFIILFSFFFLYNFLLINYFQFAYMFQ